MHSCTLVLGKTVLIASGNPFSPSTHAINISLTPLFCNSAKTDTQNLEPSLSLNHKPKSSLWPSILIASAK